MKKRSIDKLTDDYQNDLIKRLNNEEQAEIYLQLALDEYEKTGEPKLLLLALKNVALAQGGIAKLAQCTQLNRETLYRTLSEKGNPRLYTLTKILSGLGMRLLIKSNTH